MLPLAGPPTAHPWLAPTTSVAVIGGADSLSHTADGGTTWQPGTVAAAGFTGRLFALQFIDASTGWTVGQSGEILKTVDGGAGWAAEASGTTKDLHDVQFVDANDGWAVGGSNDWLNGLSGSVVLHTTDGGATWLPQTSGIAGLSYDLAGVAFVDAQRGWAAGGRDWGDAGFGVVMHTSDGGLSWTQQLLPVGDAVLNAIAFDGDGLHGWAVGEVMGDAGVNTAVIVATTDGGATWTRQLSYLPPIVGNSSDAALNGVACIDAKHAVAVGYGNGYTEIFRTVNGGAKWTRLTKPASWGLDLSDVVFTDATHGWAIGSTTVIATTDGGATWTRQSVGADTALNAVSFVNRTHGWVAGGGADILTTTTGGKTP